MNRFKYAAALLGLAMLAGCAGKDYADSQQWNRWVCDSQAEVFWRYADPAHEKVDVRMGGSDVVHRLSLEPSGSGELYSDGTLSFHAKGEEGLVYRTANDDLLGRGCKAP
ncbi:MliC family protein [Pseudomonas sp.]|jgi:membrane-bound inhibitor of C-type lysozyme|uniref:MliC family protein n=1 Tax=Pseudomonas sp. OHS18 TaxID=3399679 RepID=UPI00289E2EA1|nr:MliC family protein [Pseudomonas sp.]